MKRIVPLVLFAVSLCVSCTPAPTATPVPTGAAPPTPTVVPTNTATPTMTSVPPTATSTVTLTPTPTSTPTPTPPLNSFGYGAQLNWGSMDNDTEMRQLTQLGFKWAEIEVRWCAFESSKGVAGLSKIDNLIAAAQRYDIHVLFSVVCAPDWSRHSGGAGGSPAPDNVQDAADFMGTLAKTYCGKGLGAIEVWNYENLAFPTPKLISPAVYMDMLRRSYTAISDACPSIVVVSGGLAPIELNTDFAMDDAQYLGEMYKNGLKDLPVAIGAHLPSFCNAPDATVGSENVCNGQYNSHRSSFFGETMQEYRQATVQNGDANKLIWPTFFGWGSNPSAQGNSEFEKYVTPDLQAKWLVQAYQEMKAWGWVGVAFVFNLDFNLGLNGDYQILGRPAFDALSKMVK